MNNNPKLQNLFQIKLFFFFIKIKLIFFIVIIKLFKNNFLEKKNSQIFTLYNKKK